jgi:leucyl aminopeptidase
MYLTVKKANKIGKKDALILLIDDIDALDNNYFSRELSEYIKIQYLENDKKIVSVNSISQTIYVFINEKQKEPHVQMEKCRIAAAKINHILNDNKITEASLLDLLSVKDDSIAFLEGFLLANYQFIKYFTDFVKKENSISSLKVISENITDEILAELKTIANAVYICRDLVNEPVCNLNAEAFSKQVEALGKEVHIKVEVLNKSKIEALKMGGLLAVNKGSIEPPTFSIMEWNPEGAINKKPIVLVGKGIVYDTGGINIKTAQGMADMKCDMAGAATVATVIYAVAKSKLPLHIIGLMPATENRPCGNAYVPGDIITMFDGTQVEVQNTDAEGRMILADALAYAKKFKPQLVIDIATLTGAAHAAIGKYGIPVMQADAEKELAHLKKSGNHVYERLVELPLWEEYGELIKSDIADIKNIGGTHAGAISAGKFLEHFTDYPYIHLDIAGPAWADKAEAYKSKGGTGIGVRLLYNFIKSKTN